VNRTITIIVDEKLKIAYVTGGYELDEAGLAFTSDVLRTLLLQTERALIRKQLASEQEEPSPPEGGPAPKAVRRKRGERKTKQNEQKRKQNQEE